MANTCNMRRSPKESLLTRSFKVLSISAASLEREDKGLETLLFEWLFEWLFE